MQQRQLRLGDILDDYCPRERRVTNHAVVAMIGEAVKNLPQDLKARRPEVPWERIRVLGNFLRQEYASIDNARIWSIVTEHLDPLDAAVQALLNEAQS